MNADLEDQIIRLAVELGYLAGRDLERLPTVGGEGAARKPRETRLCALLRLGLITEAKVDELRGRLAATQRPSQEGRREHREGNEPALPQAWDRYAVTDLLGRGGMGLVYRAVDRRLKRPVALKVLEGQAPTAVQRFLTEARLQASLSHENICQVYETGEVAGHPFIAMQLIEGETLDRAAERMSLDQKVEVMARIAEAIHSAHRHGLIHRDVKPGNIMVEKLENGVLKPYVLDFGLARIEHAQGMTATGLVVGTPSYMSPEQARGEVKSLDSRSDIFSLGATLYDLLAGHPPFRASSPLEGVARLLSEDPPSLRSVAPELPSELNIIVMKCLEKEPERRYASARALAEDLRRFRDGEPILAQKASLIYRGRRWLGRNRTLSWVAAASTALVLGFATFGIRSSLSAGAQARLAQRLGQQVKEVESLLRLAHMMPLHDTSGDRHRVRQSLKGIETEIGSQGSYAHGPGHYALGHGHLSLRDYGTARKHLEEAWKSGYRQPEVAHALGQALGALYSQALEELSRLPSPERRAARQKEIEAEYRDPALAYLRQSGGVAFDSPAYGEGLIAYYEGRMDVALQKARLAQEQSPWLYEAKVLEGDTFRYSAAEKFGRGDYDGALAELQRAAEAFRAAREIGRSDPAVYIVEARRWVAVMRAQGRRGRPIQEALEGALGAFDQAIAADPGAWEAYSKKSELLWLWGEQVAGSGQDPRSQLESAVAVGAQAARLNPRDPYAWTNSGIALELRAEWEVSNGQDPRASLDRAVAMFEKAIEANPNFQAAHNELGFAFTTRARYEASLGQDPRQTLERAARAYEQSLAIDASFLNALVNRGITLTMLGSFELQHASDPRESLGKAVSSLQKALEINPNYTLSWSALADAHRLTAEVQRRLGGDIHAPISRATDAARTALEIHPGNAEAHVALGGTHRILAEDHLAQSRDPMGDLARARQAFAKAFDLKADVSGLLGEQALAELAGARWAVKTGRSPAAFLGRAQSALDRGKGIHSSSPETTLLAAEVHRWRASWQLRNHVDPTSEIVRGLRSVEKALSSNGRFPEAVASKGALYLLMARAKPGTAEGRVAAARARAVLEEGLRSRPFMAPDHEALLTEARRLSPDP